MVTTTNRLEELRKAHKLSRRQLSLKLDPTGEGPTERTLNRWETGESGIPDRFKLRLADLFEVSVVWLMGWEAQNGKGNGEEADGDGAHEEAS